jgi:hypothetical protein
MVKKGRPLSRITAERLAVAALGFIAADAERLGRFLAATGIGPADIRAAAREPLFLAGVLDHLVNSESELLAFAQESGNPAQDVVAARELLAGRPWSRDTP